MAGSSKDPPLNSLVTEFYATFMEIILESRIPTFMPPPSHSGDGSSSSSGRRVRVPAFNIVVGKFGAVLDRMEPWCKGVQDPMVINILFSKQRNNRAVRGLQQKTIRGVGNFSAKAPAGIALADSGLEQLILLERWTIEFQKHSLRSSGKVDDLQIQKGMIGPHLNYKLRIGSSGDNQRGRFSGNNELASANNVVEKKMTILLHSMYCIARLLPAQNLFRLLSNSGNCKFKLSYKVTASPLGSSTKDMTHFYFTPIETHGGQIRVSVAYRQKVPSTENEIYALCPQIITDYVGRAATFQLKNLPIEKTEQVHFLPVSAQRLSSFKFDNLQLHRAPNKALATRELEHAHTVSMGCGDYSLVDDEGLDCPFAINDVQYDNRMESAKLRSVKSDMGGCARTLIGVPGPLEAFLAFQRPAAPLSGAHQPMKDVASLLKELKMYRDFKDRLLK